MNPDRKILAKCLTLRPALSIFVLLAAAQQSAIAQSHTAIRTNTLPQIGAIEASKSARTDAQEKVTSQLLDAIKQRKQGVVLSAAPKLTAGPLIKEPEGVLVDIKGSVTPELLDNIAALKGRVVSKSERWGTIRASMPLDAIEALAADPNVKSIRAAAQAQINTIALEGAIMHAAHLASTKFNIRGKGIKVGILSDSIEDRSGSALQKAYASGALNPALVHVLPGEAGSGEAEGLAMMEIVHAIVPEAELYFATADGGPAHMADNILSLRDAGADVIVDDYTYFVESPFQDDEISMAVDEVSESGVLYFSSAANSGSKKHGTSGTWEGDFHDGGPAGPAFSAAGAGARIHVFENGITLNTIEKAGDRDTVNLFWSDPIGASSNGYDLFVVDRYGHVVKSSTTSHTGIQDPYQSIDRIHPGQSIVIVKEAGAEPRYLHLDTGRAVIRHSTEGNVRGHNASGATNAFSVAAMRVRQPTAVFDTAATYGLEDFSSDGPRRVFYRRDGSPISPGNLLSSGGEVRMKPDLTAADGVSTTVEGMNPFLGTSAAAPHAAGIAALLLSCKPRPTPAQVRQALELSASPIEGSAPNANSGFGFVMAEASAAKVCGGAVAGQPANTE